MIVIGITSVFIYKTKRSRNKSRDLELHDPILEY